MPTFKVPRLPRRRTLAAAIAAGVVGSFLVTAAPASAEVTSCTSHMNNWAKIYADYESWFVGGAAEACIGFVSNNAMDTYGQIFCAGNNQGIVTYYDVDTGSYDRHTFWPGGVYEVVNGTYTQSLLVNSDLIEVVNVQITGYSGSAICVLAIPASAAPGAVSGSRGDFRGAEALNPGPHPPGSCDPRYGGERAASLSIASGCQPLAGFQRRATARHQRLESAGTRARVLSELHGILRAGGVGRRRRVESGAARHPSRHDGIAQQLRLLRDGEGMLTDGTMPEILFARTNGLVGLLKKR